MADIIELIYEDHQWLRAHFFLLDDATEVPDLTAIWEPLATRLDTHADAEENVFYPALLAHGDAGNPEDETDDAIGDHNSIRDAVAESRKHRVGAKVWYEAVGTARTENGKHLDEEEREANARLHQELHACPAARPGHGLAALLPPARRGRERQHRR